MDLAKHAKTPMATNEKLDLDREGKPVSEKIYLGMIGLLLILLPADLTSCSVYVYVLDSKPLPKNRT